MTERVDSLSVILTTAQISVSNSHAYCKLGNGTVRDLTQDTIYTHPSSKQCNYAYTHPQEKQCNYEPDLSNYATKSELNNVSSPLKLLGTYTSGRITLSTTYNVHFLVGKKSDSSDSIYLNPSGGENISFCPSGNDNSTGIAIITWAGPPQCIWKMFSNESGPVEEGWSEGPFTVRGSGTVKVYGLL